MKRKCGMKSAPPNYWGVCWGREGTLLAKCGAKEGFQGFPEAEIEPMIQ
jgi:hypothetical protein